MSEIRFSGFEDHSFNNWNEIYFILDITIYIRLNITYKLYITQTYTNKQQSLAVIFVLYIVRFSIIFIYLIKIKPKMYFL